MGRDWNLFGIDNFEPILYSNGVVISEENKKKQPSQYHLLKKLKVLFDTNE